MKIKSNKKTIILFTLLLAMLLCLNSVCADETYKGQTLKTIENGTTSGGLYSDSYYGYEKVDNPVNKNYSSTVKNSKPVRNTGSSQQNSGTSTEASDSNYDYNTVSKFGDENVTYVYKPLDDDVEIKSGHLVIGVYIGNMHTDYPVHTLIKFNGKVYLNQTLSSTYSDSEGPTIINENITRVTSDYVIHLNVSDEIRTSGNYVNIELTESSMAKVKLATLLAGYDDGDTDQYHYSINFGQDVANTPNYKNTTVFKGVPSGSTVYDATLDAYYLASQNGAYKFNNQVLQSTDPQGGFDGSSTWNVTEYYNVGMDNALEYSRKPSGSYYKIILSTLVVKHYFEHKLPDIVIENVTSNINDHNFKNKIYLDENNSVVVKLKNMGTDDSGNFNVTLYLGDKKQVKSVESLKMGEDVTLIFDNLSVDTKLNTTVRVIIDEESKLEEVNKSNNFFTKEFGGVYTKLPDLNITAFDVNGDLAINKASKIFLNITNNGLIKSDSATVLVYVNDGNKDVLLKNENIPSLAVNQTRQITCDWTPKDYGFFEIIVTVHQNNYQEEISLNNNYLNHTVIVSNPNRLTVFVISDNSGINSYNTASNTIIEEYAGLVDIQLRTNNQIASMTDSQLKAYLESADIFIGDWIASGVYERMNVILKENPNIPSNKQNKIFLILEPPASTTNVAAQSMAYSSFKINGADKIEGIKNINMSNLYDYYYHTTRGLSYEDVYSYVKNFTQMPELYNKATLYKDMYSADGHKNMILWLLNSIDSKRYSKSYNNPPSSLNAPTYGIYREKWYSYIDSNGNWQSGYDEYMKDYINSSRPIVGLIESKMYVDAQQLQPYYAIISKLESLGLNVIPIVAYGGTDQQLDVMLKTFTNAKSIDELKNKKNQTKVYVDSVINMVAYGLGGSSFDYVSDLFEYINVPILKAVHSDYQTNEEYELSSTGLSTLSGDKWWHITISEAQGTITPTFVGGYNYYIDENTGASISGYVPHEGNIELMAKSVYNWALLKHLSNSDKKIALIYYNYPPGKQNIAASYMDPVESVLNLLNILKDNGYDVQNIPSNSTILLAQMLSQGTNVANWANGLVEVMAAYRNSSYDEIYGYQINNTYKIDLENLSEEQITALKNTPGVLLYPVSKFKIWFDNLDEINRVAVSEGPVSYIGELTKKAVKLNYNLTSQISDWYNGVLELVPSNSMLQARPLLLNISVALKNYVKTGNELYYQRFLDYKKKFLSLKIEGLSGWGEFPGNIMVVTVDGEQFYVLPGIRYGKVFIGPEPQRGWEGNAEQLYHNSIVPPHYQYLAFYSYIQQEYNAMVFMGRHATHEWMSGKEVLCSDTDFTTILTGSLPQVYFYITDGISEGLTAKRRGSAVIIDHLTPPMSMTSLYGNLSTIQSLASEYEEADNDRRQEIAIEIRDIIRIEEYDRDMNINISGLNDEQLIEAVNDYLDSLVNTMYPYGVHVLGQNWSNEEIALLVSSMLSTEYEYNSAGDSTTLLDEVSLLYENKKYDQLSAVKRNIIQEKSAALILDLLVNGKQKVLQNISGPVSEGLNYTLDLALSYMDRVKNSIKNEISSFVNALNGGYILTGTGGDPISNPDAIDTGRNFYQDQSSEIPTKKAYDKSEELLNLVLGSLDPSTKKIVLGIWDTETARDDGQLVSLVLKLLGVKPEWSNSPSAGANGKKLKETPIFIELDDLTRPANWNKTRLDVVVVLDGNFRDLYSRQVGLLDKAFRIALARSYYTIIKNETLISLYGENLTKAINYVMESIGYYATDYESLEDNAVAYNWVNDFMYYMSINMTPEEAGEYAISRIFAPPDQDYGAMISQAVRQSWTYNNSNDLAVKYLNRMGYIYSSTTWGSYNSQVLTRLLNGTTSLFTSRNTNLYGVIDNDDYFDYWGGLYNAMYYLNQKDINFYVIRYGDTIKASLIDIGQYIKRELNSRYYNPNWITAMIAEGYSGAGYMSKFVSNMYGWSSVTDKITNKDWDNLVDVYINDKYNTGVTDFLKSGYNAYSLISITGTLLTAAHENKWKTDEATLRRVANLWAQSVIDNGVACCDCSCGNVLMMDWSLQFINADLLSQFKARLYQATQNKLFFEDGYSENPEDTDGKETGTNTQGNGNQSASDKQGESEYSGDTSGSDVGDNQNPSSQGGSSENTGSGESSNTDNKPVEDSNNNSTSKTEEEISSNPDKKPDESSTSNSTSKTEENIPSNSDKKPVEEPKNNSTDKPTEDVPPKQYTEPVEDSKDIPKDNSDTSKNMEHINNTDNQNKDNSKDKEDNPSKIDKNTVVTDDKRNNTKRDNQEVMDNVQKNNQTENNRQSLTGNKAEEGEVNNDNSQSQSNSQSGSTSTTATTVTVTSSGNSPDTVMTTAHVSNFDESSKAFELTKAKKGSAITESAMSAIGIIFVCLLVGSVAFGYYRKRK